MKVHPKDFLRRLIRLAEEYPDGKIILNRADGQVKSVDISVHLEVVGGDPESRFLVDKIATGLVASG